MTEVYRSAKYRSQVKSNEDEDRIGRVKVEITALKITTWAMPNVPYAGEGVGLYLIPPVGSWVWVEFENGNPETPIWTGCFWEKQGDLPKAATSPAVKMLETNKGRITINDLSGEIAVERINTKPQKTIKIVMNDEKIELTFGTDSVTLDSTQILIKKDGSKIELMASKITVISSKVSINNGNLEVT